MNWYHIIIIHATKVAHLLSKVTTLTKIKIKYCKIFLKFNKIPIYLINLKKILKNNLIQK